MARTPRRKTQMKSPFSIPEISSFSHNTKSITLQSKVPAAYRDLLKEYSKTRKVEYPRNSSTFSRSLLLKNSDEALESPFVPKKPPTKVPPSPKTILKSRNEVMENILVFSEPNEKVRQSGDHRPIVIDGCNVAHEFADATNAGNKSFLWRGVQLCIEFFSRRGHDEIVVFVPRNKAGTGDPNNKRIIDELSRLGHIIFTPSRTSTTRRFRSFSSYDDRYIVQYATIHGGIIISNDNYYDLIGESQAMCETIKNRVLKFNFVGRSTLMFPLDPLGKSGPTLYNFLRF
ncbi:ZC3H12 [Lepeophtheirus salmonis]|uniref:ZC3H12 n=1 Tax=Lepeophtheirus salmonis TaxID=72036 RepID=A0A7R8CG92_LEPSM|nr:ZC3H12 [Lepeophtheirus salmonis]CAF2813458.1 ZC3H12 [Lepeophtheirus salmonis]